MSQLDAPIQRARRKPSPLVLIMVGILLVAGIFLLFPSGKAIRQNKALKLLSSEYVGPKSLSSLYGGYFVTKENNFEKVQPSDKAQIIVFAPKPTDQVPYNFMDSMNYYQAPSDQKPKIVCLLAPDAACADWTLFAMVWIGQSLEANKNGTPNMSMTNLSYSYTSPTKAFPAPGMTFQASTIKEFKKTFSEFDPQIQAMALDTLEANRKLVKSMTGIHQYYQDGKGTNYEIRSPRGIWEFEQAIQDAYPNRRSGR